MTDQPLDPTVDVVVDPATITSTDNTPKDSDGEQDDLDQSPDSAYDADGTPEVAS